MGNKKLYNEMTYNFIRDWGDSYRVSKSPPGGIDELIDIAKESTDYNDFVDNYRRVDEETREWFLETYNADIDGINRAAYNFIMDVAVGTFK